MNSLDSMLCRTGGMTTPGSNTPPTDHESDTADFPEPPSPSVDDNQRHRHEARRPAPRYGCSLDDPHCKEMILVMGRCGAGKSSFINTLVGGDVAAVGDGITPCTIDCQLVPARIGKTKVILVDTPDCEDYSHSPGALLFRQIFTTLARQYQRGVSLRGIIYIQPIPLQQEPQICSPERIFKMFLDICGDSKLLFRNVILATRSWQIPELEESIAAFRENEYCKSWAPILAHGSTMARYYGERDSAISIASRILGNVQLPHEPEEDLVRKGQNIISQMKMNVARDLERLWEQSLMLR